MQDSSRGLIYRLETHYRERSRRVHASLRCTDEGNAITPQKLFGGHQQFTSANT